MATTTKLQPNTNRNQLLTGGSQSLWVTAGRRFKKHSSDSRAGKDAIYRTGAERIYARKSGTGRPLNERPKKSGAGGHNWGWPGMEVGVELATKEELNAIEREFNPTVPTPEEEFSNESEEWGSGDDDVTESPFAEQLADKDGDQNRRVAFSIGGAPSYANSVAWGDKESSRALAGTPVITWGKELPRSSISTFSQEEHGGGCLASTRSAAPAVQEDRLLGSGTSDKVSTIPEWGVSQHIVELKILERGIDDANAQETTKTQSHFDTADSVSQPS